MADEPDNLPAVSEAKAAIDAHFGAGKMSLAMAIMLDQNLFDRCKMIAKYMAEAEGFTPKHLIGKTQACFFVVTKALTWKLDPMAVANATYETPGGKVGFEGKLVQAILENSGHLEGTPKYEHYGDWSRLKGKWEVKKSQKGNDYTAVTWTPADAEGLGVTVIAKVRGEEEPRKWSLDLDQCYPLNSTLWATDPKSQICYTAVRRFANLATPGILMGVPFDREDWSEPVGRPDLAKDVTPAKNGKAKLEEFVENHTPKAEPAPTSLGTLNDQLTRMKGEDPDPDAQREAARQAFMEGTAKAAAGDPDTGELPLDDNTSEPERRVAVTWAVTGHQVMLLPEKALSLWAEKSDGKTDVWKRAVLNRNPELAKLVLQQENKKQERPES